MNSSAGPSYLFIPGLFFKLRTFLVQELLLDLLWAGTLIIERRSISEIEVIKGVGKHDVPHALSSIVAPIHHSTAQEVTGVVLRHRGMQRQWVLSVLLRLFVAGLALILSILFSMRRASLASNADEVILRIEETRKRLMLVFWAALRKAIVLQWTLLSISICFKSFAIGCILPSILLVGKVRIVLELASYLVFTFRVDHAWGALSSHEVTKRLLLLLLVCPLVFVVPTSVGVLVGVLDKAPVLGNMVETWPTFVAKEEISIVYVIHVSYKVLSRLIIRVKKTVMILM